ncbi:MAG: phosphoglycerate kinase [bacterium]|nr:phosphoglycerate kinase [bacterium]
MTVPSLNDLVDVDGHRVLARLDLNVPLADGVVRDETRIVAALPTLKWLLERNCVIAACSHLGKAKGVANPQFSLAPVAKLLSTHLGIPVRFVSDCVGSEVTRALDEADGPALVLLENLRFHAGEKANDSEFAAQLSAPYSHYVNDAFGTAHRAHASVEATAELFAPGRRAAGFLMEREVSTLTQLITAPEPPFVAIVGGAKVSSKTAPLATLLERATALAIGGGMANTFALAKGLEIGKSLFEEEMVTTALEIQERAESREVDLLLPEDVVVTDDLKQPTTVETVAIDAVTPDAIIADIGPRSLERIVAAVANARTVFWNGPLGVFEIERFAAGTLGVAKALGVSPAFTVAGGGETAMAIRNAGVTSDIDHVSTGGGASLKLVSGGDLPALRALGG